MNLQTKGGVVNTGTIAGRTAVKIDAGSIDVIGGRISGGNVALGSTGNLNIIGGMVDARDAMTLKAGGVMKVRFWPDFSLSGRLHDSRNRQAKHCNCNKRHGQQGPADPNFPALGAGRVVNGSEQSAPGKFDGEARRQGASKQQSPFDKRHRKARQSRKPSDSEAGAENKVSDDRANNILRLAHRLRLIEFCGPLEWPVPADGGLNAQEVFDQPRHSQ